MDSLGGERGHPAFYPRGDFHEDLERGALPASALDT
jgi:hypothetical protein